MKLEGRLKDIADKTLWYITLGRDLDLFLDWMGRVDFVDKLLVKYFMKHDADDIAMKYFFDNPKYEYMIISTDDVLGNPYQVKLLLEDELKHGFPVISGWNDWKRGFAAVSMKPVDVELFNRKGIGFKRYQFESMKSLILPDHGYPFIEVGYMGLPLTLIKKDVLRRVPFKPFTITHSKLFCATTNSLNHGRGVMQDVQFSLDCKNNNIPITVDLRIFLLHGFGTKRFVKVGVEKPRVELIKAGETKAAIIESQINIEAYILRTKEKPFRKMLPTPETPIKPVIYNRPKVIKPEDVKPVNPIIQSWSERIEINISIGQRWSKGFPYTWWRGMNSRSFIKNLLGHLDERAEPLWFK